MRTCQRDAWNVVLGESALGESALGVPAVKNPRPRPAPTPP